jgi:Protein of unknown function (DUF1176)
VPAAVTIPGRGLRAARAVVVAAALTLGSACGSKGSSGQSPSTTAARPAPPQAPRLRTRDLTVADRRAWRAAIQWPESCERGFAPSDSSSAGLEFLPLSGGRVVAQVMCSLGAYQPTYLYYVVDTSASSAASSRVTGPLEFKDYVDSGTPGPNRLTAEQTTEVVGLPEYVPDRRQLRVFRRFRGVGDCGLLLTYEIADTRAVLREARGKLACNGRGPRDPSKWPVLKLPD